MSSYEPSQQYVMQRFINPVSALNGTVLVGEFVPSPPVD